MKTQHAFYLILMALSAKALSGDAQSLIDQAIQSAQAAAEQGHAWTVTEAHIQAAQAALDAADSSEALLLAERALRIAQASLEQSKIEAASWQRRVPQ